MGEMPKLWGIWWGERWSYGREIVGLLGSGKASGGGDFDGIIDKNWVSVWVEQLRRNGAKSTIFC